MKDIKKKKILTGVFTCFVLLLVGVQNAEATTFPVNEAGIAAYVKLDSVDITDLTEALNYFYSVEEQNETYVIGTVKVENIMGKYVPFYNYPRVYIGLDGWIVAYFSNTEQASRIMQWKGYENGTISTTTLKDAIDIICANTGVTYSTSVKYYDFEFPDANKMTVIAEELGGETLSSRRSNSFSVIIPNTLYEASYNIYSRPTGHDPCRITLTVDVNDIFNQYFESCNWYRQYYGYYDPLTLLEVNVPHSITFLTTGRYAPYAKAATVLIYEN